MNIPRQPPSFSPGAPAKLYALQLRLRPLRTGTLMPFNGELVHGALLNWLRSEAPDVSAWLHQGVGRRFFTCSGLQWPLPAQRMLEAERENIHMPLDPQKLYTIRVTLLHGELFPLFYQALLKFIKARDEGEKPPFMRIGKQVLTLEDVVLTNDDPSGWTGFTSFTQLVEQAAAHTMKKEELLTLEFASLTTITRSGNKEGEYGTFYALLPLPHYIFPTLATRWEEVAPPELAHVVQKELVEEYLLNDGMIIFDYALRTHHAHYTTHVQPGFLGTCSYLLRGPDRLTAPGNLLTVRQQIWLLAQFAFYSGVGYKTAMGMGRTRMTTLLNHSQG